ncbi:MAG TPA: zf-HC2 domain-containing protein [Gemmatimonadales bacterium]|nr:zf-HC2 domain-containing protein [Gemmatimonadales bacterium]
MTHDTWTDRLSEYVDGELPAGERLALEAHLAECAECRAIVDDLRAVVTTARRLPDLPPARDLWPTIAERTTGVLPFAPRRAPRVAVTWPRLAAAAALFLAIGSGATWFALGGGRTASPAAVATAPSAATTVPVAAAAPRPTDAAVAELEKVLADGRARLDTQTVRVVTENLARIDTAIAEAQRALAADPANVYVSRHLADAERRKLALLRTAARLVQSQS